MSAGASLTHPFFLPGSAGDLFCVRYLPQNGDFPNRAVLLFPPFAEELNKSRRMIALQARRFAEAGCAVLVIDLFGTGDSAGDFAAARWDKWCADLYGAAEYLRACGARQIVAWGLRSGALLALDVARERIIPIERFLLWQPVIRGEQMLTQFLRLRLAAELGKGDPQNSATTQDMRAALSRGDALEIAGYTLAPELAVKIDTLDLKALAKPGMPPVDWFEIVAAADRPLTPASRAVIDAWRTQGISVEAHAVAGEPFWNTLEIETVPALIEATTQRLREGCL